MTQHEISTINDIYSVVDETNVDGFLKDFETWLRMMVELKEIDPTMKVIRVDNFGWNDDGDNGTLKGVTFSSFNDVEEVSDNAEKGGV